MAMFEFRLAPMDEIGGWGEEPNLHLHWFGLTDGTYWIDLGDVRLFEYVERVAGQRYVEYNISRLHEDVLEVLPHALDPLPPDIVARLQDNSLEKTYRALEQEYEFNDDPPDLLNKTILVLSRRALQSSHLCPSANIWFWGYDAKVVIEWDNRDRLIDGEAAFTAAVGRHEMDREVFFEEVRSFDARLMAAMEERIAMVRESWSRPDVIIDMQQLVDEHPHRVNQLHKALGPISTDWEIVRSWLESTKSP